MMILRPVRPGVAHRAADLEPAGRVDEQPVPGRVDVEAGQHRVDDVVLDVGGEQFLEVDVGRVLAGDDHRVEPDRLVARVLDRHLGLAVRPQVRHLAGAAHRGQLPRQPVRQHDRQRHQLRGLPAGVAEHQALVARALPVVVVGALALAVLERVGHALGDVRRLRADGHRDAAGRAVVALGGGVVADLQDLLADDAGDVHVGLGGHLAGHVHLAGRDQRLDRDPALRVVLEHRVQDGVADLVGHLVRVALRHRLRGKQPTSHVIDLHPKESADQVKCSRTNESGKAEPMLAAGRRGRSAQPGGDQVPARRRPGRPSTGAESAVTVPSAASTTHSLSAAPKPWPSPTWFTTSRSQPLRASLARAASRSGLVSAAKPTITWPAGPLGPAAPDRSARMSGFSVSSIGGGQRCRPS